MKRIAILLSLLIAVNVGFAQKNKRTSAFNYHRYGKLDKAKEAIDEAVVHEKTMNDAKTWYYFANIYLDIAKSEESQYKNLDPNAAARAFEGYKKAMELDEKNEFLLDITPRILATGEVFYNKGVLSYNKGMEEKSLPDFVDAAKCFHQSYNVGKHMGSIDTSALFNVAVSYELGEDFDNASKIYKELIDYRYNNAMIYISLSEILKVNGDTTQAKDVVILGRELFPSNYPLLISQTNFYLNEGETNKALDNLKVALEYASDNPTIYLAVGNMYDFILSDTTKTEEERFSAYTEAKKSYLKAIELKPDFFDAVYNLGALYFNRGANILIAADVLPLGDASYDVEKEKGDNFLKAALPYLEKALELEPDNYETLFSLRQIYSRTSDTEKWKIVDEKLKDL